MRPGPTEVLLVVDVQNDFCPGGAFAVNGGGEIVPLINRLGESSYRDAGLASARTSPLSSAHPGRKPFETIELPCGPQTL